MIVVAGESLVDLLVDPSGAVSAVPGGGPFNVARTVARLGSPVAYAGRLSTDAFGRMLRAHLVADGVDLALTAETDDPTLLAVADLDAAGNATYRFHVAGTAAAGFGPADAARVPSDVQALHVGSLGLVLEPMAAAIEGLVARVSDRTLLMVDPNIRPAAIVDDPAVRARLARVLRRADVMKASVEDLARIRPGIDPGVAAREILAAGPTVVLVTDGADPVRIVARGVDAVAVEVPATAVVDTIGAGDAFCGGFLAAWAGAGLGRSALADIRRVVEAVRFAVTVAAWTVGRAGAEPPTTADLAGPAPMTATLGAP